MALRKILRGVKGTGYDDVQNLVREATSNDPTSPPDDVVIEIIKQASIGSNKFASVSEILWKRINDVNYPRHVCKALILLQYLLRKGDNRELFVEHTRAHVSEIENLKTYTSDVAKGLSSLDLEIREHAVKICNYVLGIDRSEDRKFDLKPQAAGPSFDATEDDDEEDKSQAVRQDSGKNNLGVPTNSRARAHSGDGPHSARDNKPKKTTTATTAKKEDENAAARTSSRRQSLPAKQPKVPQQQNTEAPKPAAKKVDSFEDMFAAPAASKPKSEFDDFDKFFGTK